MLIISFLIYFAITQQKNKYKNKTLQTIENTLQQFPYSHISVLLVAQSAQFMSWEKVFGGRRFLGMCFGEMRMELKIIKKNAESSHSSNWKLKQKSSKLAIKAEARKHDLLIHDFPKNRSNQANNSKLPSRKSHAINKQFYSENDTTGLIHLLWHPKLLKL